MRTAPKYLSGSSLLVEAKTMVPSGRRTLSLEAWPDWMPAGFAGSQVRPQSLVFRIHN